MDWSPPTWAKPPLDKVSLIALCTAIPGFGLVSLGIWGVIRTKNHQRRGRTPGRDQLRADRPVGDRRNRRRRDGRAFGHVHHRPDDGAGRPSTVPGNAGRHIGLARYRMGCRPRYLRLAGFRLRSRRSPTLAQQRGSDPAQRGLGAGERSLSAQSPPAPTSRGGAGRHRTARLPSRPRSAAPSTRLAARLAVRPVRQVLRADSGGGHPLDPNRHIHETGCVGGAH